MDERYNDGLGIEITAKQKAQIIQDYSNKAKNQTEEENFRDKAFIQDKISYFARMDTDLQIYGVPPHYYKKYYITKNARLEKKK